jgi:hypothetical protein
MTAMHPATRTNRAAITDDFRGVHRDRGALLIGIETPDSWQAACS